MLLLRARRTVEMNDEEEEKTTNHSRRMCQLQQYIVSSEKKHTHTICVRMYGESNAPKQWKRNKILKIASSFSVGLCRLFVCVSFVLWRAKKINTLADTELEDVYLNGSLQTIISNSKQSSRQSEQKAEDRRQAEI